MDNGASQLNGNGKDDEDFDQVLDEMQGDQMGYTAEHACRYVDFRCIRSAE